jgi:hypothetical protein
MIGAVATAVKPAAINKPTAKAFMVLTNGGVLISPGAKNLYSVTCNADNKLRLLIAT